MKPTARAVHPIPLGIASALSLYSENWRLVPPVELLLATAASLVLLAAAWTLARRVYRDGLKSALATSTFIFFFYSYGRIHAAFFGKEATESSRGWHALLLSIYVLAFVGIAWGIAKISSDLRRATLILNFAAVVFVAIPLAKSLFGVSAHALASRRQAGAAVDVAESRRFPDIYYIVLDAYARADILKKVFDYDNRVFLESLAEMGFHVDGASVANYNQTYLSLASSLNFSYLQDIEFLKNYNGSSAGNRIPLRMLIHRSRIIQTLQRLGYVFVTFPSGYHATSFENADILIETRWTPSEFQDGLIATTPIPGLLEVFAGKDPYDWHRQRILNILNKLDSVAGELSRPAFVFAHVFSPHPPFVFAADGGDARASRPFTTDDGSHFFTRHGGTEREYVEGYTHQVSFLNRQLLATLERILEASSAPPIVIVQADHGSGFGMSHESLEATDLQERFAILNALYLPGLDDRDLPPRLSPVNTFRLVLNHYFGTRLELLPNRSYYATWDSPYRYVDVTDRLHD